MSAKFSTTKEVTDTTNYMGERAYKRNPKAELVGAVLTSFIESTYYEKAEKRIERIGDLVEEVSKKDPAFVAKLAIFARDEFNMRSSSHVLIGELAQSHKGDNIVSRAVERLALRPDDVIEIVAYVNKPIPNQIKKGAAAALYKFDEYQLAKYRATNHKMSLVDVVNLVRPQHTEALAKLVHDDLRNKDTWESRVSAAKGNKAEAAQAWKDLLKTHKLGYMAALRNLRSIAQTGDAETIQLAGQFISNPKAIANSRQFPFRFLSAYEALQGADAGSPIAFEKDVAGIPELISAVESAVTLSVGNIPLLPGKTAILADNSGSMRGDRGGSGAISANSSRTSANIANLFAVLYWMRADNTYVGLFGDHLVQPELDRTKGVFENYNLITKAADKTGMATEQGIYDFFDTALRDRIVVDRVVIFSDMQIGRNSWYGHKPGTRQTFNQLFQKYREFNPTVKVFSVDLRGYGTTVFSDNVMEFSGFSEKLFTIMDLAEQDKNALITRINEVEL